MKNLSVLFFAFLFSAISIHSEELKWYSFNEGVELAKSQNKILLVDFYTDWCGWCKKMDAETYTNEEIIKMINDKFIPVKVNPEKDGMLKVNGKEIQAATFAQSMGVSGYPAIGFFNPNAELIQLVPGYKTTDEFKKLLDFFVTEKYKLVDFNNYMYILHFESELSKSPENIELNFLLGFIYHKLLQDFTKANEFYNKALQDYSLKSFVLVSLSELEAKNGNKETALKYYQDALNAGFTNFDDVNQKISELAQKYSPKK